MRKFSYVLLSLLLLFATVQHARAQFADQMVWGGTSGGSANSQTLAVSNLGGSVPVGVKFAGIAGFTNSGPTQLNIGSTSLINVYKLTSSGPAALSGGEIRAGNVFVVLYDGTQYQLLTGVDTSGTGTLLLGSPVNAAAALTTAGTTVTFTTDQIAVGTALSGQSYRLSSFSQALNISTTGIGGMDTGSAPTNGFVSIYAAYNPSTSSVGIFATNAATSTSEVYAGANAPSGYTATGLIATLPTNGSSQLKPFLLRNRTVMQLSVTVLSGGTASSFTSVSLSSAVPANAKMAGGTIITPSDHGVNIASDSGGLFGFQTYGTTTTTSGIQMQWGMPLNNTTPQTLYYRVGGTGGATIGVTTYSF